MTSVRPSDVTLAMLTPPQEPHPSLATRGDHLLTSTSSGARRLPGPALEVPPPPTLPPPLILGLLELRRQPIEALPRATSTGRRPRRNVARSNPRHWIRTLRRRPSLHSSNTRSPLATAVESGGVHTVCDRTVRSSRHPLMPPRRQARVGGGHVCRARVFQGCACCCWPRARVPSACRVCRWRGAGRGRSG